MANFLFHTDGMSGKAPTGETDGNCTQKVFIQQTTWGLWTAHTEAQSLNTK